MKSKSVAELIIDQLSLAGVRHCYGVVGDTLNYVTDAMSRSDIRWVHVRHEEAAGLVYTDLTSNFFYGKGIIPGEQQGFHPQLMEFLDGLAAALFNGIRQDEGSPQPVTVAE